MEMEGVTNNVLNHRSIRTQVRLVLCLTMVIVEDALFLVVIQMPFARIVFVTYLVRRTIRLPSIRRVLQH